MKTARYSLDGIEVGERLRPLDERHVQRLAESIRGIGLQTPITVRTIPDGDDLRVIVIAGAHRLAALRSLGEDDAECIVANDDPDFAELWEIEENFARSELTDAQRADHHARREAIMVRQGLVRTNGGDRRSDHQIGELKPYAAQAAESLGVHANTVRRDLRRGKDISPDVLAEVSGSPLDKGVVLDELASTPREDQRAKLAEITLRRSEAERARRDAEATNRATDRVIAMTDAESAAEIVLGGLDLVQVEALTARLAAVAMKDFITALKRGTGMSRSQPEFRLACVVADFLERFAPDLAFTHVPLGENRDAITGARLKRMGTKRGWPDYVAVVPPTGRLLALELKAEGGRQSPEQKAVQARLEAAGAAYALIRSLPELEAVLAAHGVPTRVAA